MRTWTVTGRTTNFMRSSKNQDFYNLVGYFYGLLFEYLNKFIQLYPYVSIRIRPTTLIKDSFMDYTSSRHKRVSYFLCNHQKTMIFHTSCIWGVFWGFESWTPSIINFKYVSSGCIFRLFTPMGVISHISGVWVFSCRR